MLEIIYSPINAINDVQTYTKPLIYSIIISVIYGLFSFLFAFKFAGVTNALILGLIVVGMLFLTMWICAGILTLTINLLETDNIGYLEGLVSVVYSQVPKSLGFLGASLLLFIPVVGKYIAAVLLAAAITYSIIIFLRAIKELFGVELLTAIIGGFITGIFWVMIVAFVIQMTLLQAGFVLLASFF